jgi:hypothetical protein
MSDDGERLRDWLFADGGADWSPSADLLRQLDDDPLPGRGLSS